jgi:cytochrome c peroxidase
LIDGKFDHGGKLKGPILRSLSSRAPYFHNGSARTLLDVVRFYEVRFGVSFTAQEESDLVAFLKRPLKSRKSHQDPNGSR